MNVYVESNFVLELALMQEEHESCEGILTLCESNQAQLFVPAYSLAEPLETLIRRDKNRIQMAQAIKSELDQLGRSIPYQEETAAFQAIISLLTRSGFEERQRLTAVRDRLLRTAHIIPLNKAILESASLLEIQHGLSPQDAIVYTSVLEHLNASGSDKSCFLNKDQKLFSDPDLIETLTRNSCKVLFHFQDGYSYIRNQAI